MKILIFSDPLEGLKPTTDTGIAMLREALNRGHQVYWSTPSDYSLWNHEVHVESTQVEACAENALPELASDKVAGPISTFDTVWLRKEPPFDAYYLSLCWLLALHENKIPMLNKPSHLIRYHEKLLPLEALHQGYLKPDNLIQTFLSFDEDCRAPEKFPAGPCISKPWFGHGGRDVEKWDSFDDALESSFGPEPSMTLFQPFLPEITKTGDRRVLFIDGKALGDFVRIPQAGSIRANLVQGASAELREMSPQELTMTAKLGEFLAKNGIHFAGADYIDGKLSEVNITCPTGFQTLVELGGPNLSVDYVTMAERAIK